MVGIELARFFIGRLELPDSSFSELDVAVLAHDLDNKIQRAELAWPGVEVSSQPFAAYIAERMPSGEVPELGTIDVTGLFLAHACSLGNPRAQRHLYETYRPRLVGALQRLKHAIVIDDVIQVTFEKLLRSNEGIEMKITKFNGKSTLDKWLVAVAFRQGYRALKRRPHVERNEVHVDVCDAIVEATDPELRVLKHSYRTQFKVALHEAFGMLEPGERNIFRFQYIDKLNLEQFGALLGVSRATAARRRTQARSRLCELTRQLLRQRLGLSGEDLDSVIALIQSQLDVSLTRLLALPTASARNTSRQQTSR